MRSTTGTVYYLERGPYAEEKPYFCCLPKDMLQGNPPTNHVHVPVSVSVTDIRGHEGEFGFAKNGFELARQNLGPGFDYQSVVGGSDVEARYIAEMEAFIKEHLGAAKVVIFDIEVGVTEPSS